MQRELRLASHPPLTGVGFYAQLGMLAVSVAIYNEGTGGGPQELLLSIRLPGAHSKSVTNTYGLVAAAQSARRPRLGAGGHCESGTFYLKRPKRMKK